MITCTVCCEELYIYILVSNKLDFSVKLDNTVKILYFSYRMQFYYCFHAHNPWLYLLKKKI